MGPTAKTAVPAPNRAWGETSPPLPTHEPITKHTSVKTKHSFRLPTTPIVVCLSCRCLVINPSRYFGTSVVCSTDHITSDSARRNARQVGCTVQQTPALSTIAISNQNRALLLSARANHVFTSLLETCHGIFHIKHVLTITQLVNLTNNRAQ